MKNYAIWLVFSSDARFATSDYHKWLCAFQHETGVESLWDFSFLDLRLLEEIEVWHALSAADQQHIATLFGRDGSGRPRFTQQALATLKALCKTRLRTCSGEYQWQLIFNLTEELNKERSYLQGGNAAQRQLAASMHYFHVPDHILWMMKREHHTRQPYEDIRLSNTE